MLEFIETPQDVLALKMGGRISGPELDAVMDRVDAAFQENEKLHLFIETLGIDSIELHALPHYLSRALPMFGKLDRFGRVAVVADQAWVRLGTRVESAILPSITYRVFEPGEREIALNWVLTGNDRIEA
jgi:hypothetical protein